MRGRQITAARALAGLTIRDLATGARTTPRMIAKIETGGPVRVSAKRRHGHVSDDLWQRVLAALAAAGVELIEESDGRGGGARWAKH